MLLLSKAFCMVNMGFRGFFWGLFGRKSKILGRSGLCLVEKEAEEDRVNVRFSSALWKKLNHIIG